MPFYFYYLFLFRLFLEVSKIHLWENSRWVASKPRVTQGHYYPNSPALFTSPSLTRIYRSVYLSLSLSSFSILLWTFCITLLSHCIPWYRFFFLYLYLFIFSACLVSPDPLFCITQQMFWFSLWSLHIMLTHISAFHLKVATITKACSLSPLEEIIFLFWDNWILTCSLKSGEIRIKRQSNGQTNYPV